MRLAELLMTDFNHEIKGTRRTLERVPEDRLDFRAHPKSMALGRLAGHLAELPIWASNAVKLESLDVGPKPGPREAPLVMTSRAQLLQVLDDNVSQARELLAPASDEHLEQDWTLLFAGRKVFAMPRHRVIRNVVLSHMVHHRAQLGVYLRLLEIPVPSLYGPSADEKGFPG